MQIVIQHKNTLDNYNYTARAVLFKLYYIKLKIIFNLFCYRLVHERAAEIRMGLQNLEQFRTSSPERSRKVPKGPEKSQKVPKDSETF